MNTVPQQPRSAPSYNPPAPIAAPQPPPGAVHLPYIQPTEIQVEKIQPNNYQFEFNFDRKVRYEDIENKLTDMEIKIDKQIAIAEAILKELTNSPKPKKKVSGYLDGSNLL
jgi:hypothetical protein